MSNSSLYKKVDIEECISEDIYFSTWPHHPKKIWIEGNASLSFGLKISKKLQNSFITTVMDSTNISKTKSTNYKLIDNISILDINSKLYTDNFNCHLYIYIEAISLIGDDCFVDYVINRNKYNLSKGEIFIIDRKELIVSAEITHKLGAIRSNVGMYNINTSPINDIGWEIIMINFNI